MDQQYQSHPYMMSNTQTLSAAAPTAVQFGQQPQQHQQQQQSSALSYPAGVSIMSNNGTAAVALPGTNFVGSSNPSGPLFVGRVPNFSPQYLASLNNANSLFEQQQQQQQRQQYQSPVTVMGAPQLAKMNAQQQQQQSLTPRSYQSMESNNTITTGEQPYNLSNSTIVTNTVSSAASQGAATAPGSMMSVSPPRVVITSPKLNKTTISCNINSLNQQGGGGGATIPQQEVANKRDRRHSMPSSIVLSPSQRNSATPPTHPVPEFLCHLYSMLSDPALCDTITWVVPKEDEPTNMGGGRAGIGKIIVHNPTKLQDEVLGKYYRHSKYSSFQRQLNYFGFKKRLHGSKKGKMCPCSFVHDTLGCDPQSLLNLKRRPPSSSSVGGGSGTSKGRVGSESSLSEVGKAKKKVGTGSNRPKKYKKRQSLSIPISTFTSGQDVNMVTATKNAVWGTNTMNNTLGVSANAIQGGGGSMNNNMPLSTLLVTAQQQGTQAAPMGKTVWPPPSMSSTAALNNSTAATQESSMRDANAAAVLEARKSLEENFLKSQQERCRKGDTLPENVISIQPRPSTKSFERMCNTPLLQQQQQQQQQQQNQMMQIPTPFPNPFSTTTGGVTATTTQPLPTITPIGTTGKNEVSWTGPTGKSWMMEQEMFKPLQAVAAAGNNNVIINNSSSTNNNNNTVFSSASSMSSSVGLAVPQGIPRGISFPSKIPTSSSINNGTVIGPAPGTADTAMNASTNYPMAPTSTTANIINTNMFGNAFTSGSGMMPTANDIGQSITNNHQQPQVVLTGAPGIGLGGLGGNGGLSKTPPVQFGDLFSNLLSTALPPSEELFDDDLSAGNISDWSVGALKVADDGMLLP